MKPSSYCDWSTHPNVIEAIHRSSGSSTEGITIGRKYCTCCKKSKPLAGSKRPAKSIFICADCKETERGKAIIAAY